MPGPWVDLTRVVDAALPIYTEPGYADPPFRASPWCSIPDRGFEVWRLDLGTQTGTHVDAPAHFARGGATLDTLMPADLVGRYLYIDASAPVFDNYADEPMLLLDGKTGATLQEATFAVLLALPCRVWLLAGTVIVAGRDPLHLHRTLAESGRFLVEDLDPEASARIPPLGEAIALPLRLSGVSGSPARVLVRSL